MAWFGENPMGNHFYCFSIFSEQIKWDLNRFLMYDVTFKHMDAFGKNV